MSLEVEEINFFKVKKDEIEGSQIVLSGLAMYSSLAVGEVQLHFDGEAISVYIYMVKAKKGLKGNFVVPLSIQDNIRKVYFGNKKKLVWKR